MIATAQEIYEMDESEQLLRAKEFLRQGHEHLCAAVMATGDDCLCKMEAWRRSRSEKADKIIEFMRETG